MLSRRFSAPGAPLTYFNDRGVRQRFIFYTPKNPNLRICLPKKSLLFFSIPKKIPQCFCISKFYYLSSGKLKHANFNFGFGQNKTINCAYVIFYLSWWKVQYPKKSLCCFCDPKKSQRLSQTQKNPFWPKFPTQKNPSDPPIIKICEWGPWVFSF